MSVRITVDIKRMASQSKVVLQSFLSSLCQNPDDLAMERGTFTKVHRTIKLTGTRVLTQYALVC